VLVCVVTSLSSGIVIYSFLKEEYGSGIRMRVSLLSSGVFAMDFHVLSFYLVCRDYASIGGSSVRNILYMLNN
jgi:hypothetical protein